MAALVEIKGLDEINKFFQNLPAKLEGRIVRGGLKVGAISIAEKARLKAPSKSGALKSGIRVTSSVKKGVATATIHAGDNKSWYAHIIEFGSGSHYSGTLKRSKRKPYKIKPKRKSSLVINGRRVASVIHPGVKPRKFMRDAFDRGYEEAIQSAAKYMRSRIARENLKR